MQRSAAERQFSCLFNTISANSFYIWLIFSFYQNNSTCNAIFCLTSCRTRCQVQSAVFKIYSYCTNGLNFAPQLYRNTHANICYSCLSVCHWTSLAFSLRWVRLLNFAVAKPPRLLDSYGLGAVISLLRPPSKQRKSKVQVLSLMHDWTDHVPTASYAPQNTCLNFIEFFTLKFIGIISPEFY